MARVKRLATIRIYLWATAWLAASLLAAPARSAELLTEAAIRSMVAELDAAAVARQIGPWEARLAPECDIAMQVTAFGQLKTTHFSRREYLELTQKLWTEFAKQKVAYTYEAGPITVRLQPAEKAGIVTGVSTETLTYPDGQQLVTQARSTMRIELRDGRLMIVSIVAVAND